MIEKAKKAIGRTGKLHELLARITALTPGEQVHVTGVPGSMLSIVLAVIEEDLGGQIHIVVPDDLAGQKIRDDLLSLARANTVRRFEGSPVHTTSQEVPVSGVEDVETLRALIDGSAAILISSAEAVCGSVPNPTLIESRFIRIGTGEDCDFERTVKTLVEFGFAKKQFVETVGDYSVRGGILDVFPYTGDNPIRVEFYADTIESIREFDAISQRSIKHLAAVRIVPDLLSAGSISDVQQSSFCTILDYLAPNALLCLYEPGILQGIVDENARTHPGKKTWAELAELFGMFPQVHISSLAFQGTGVIDFGATSQPSMNGSVIALKDLLAGLQRKHFEVCITSDTKAEEERLKDLLLGPTSQSEERFDTSGPNDEIDISSIAFSLDSLHEGFLLPDAQFALITEHQIFNRVKRRGKRRKVKFRGLTQKELFELRKGDYVVHSDYGIGRFDGLRRIRVRDIEQEVVKLLYEEKDTLYVNLNHLNKVQKYASKEGHIPKLTRLGSGEWDKLKARVKKRVKDIARDLIKLYAKRKHSSGYAFLKDTLWQRELEASFIYEDTPDQARTTTEVKQDMEAPVPMDRLVCGDVGFGKTEVAVRAAFKAVMSGKQTVVLVPTTILAEQHFHTFVDRLSKYSTRIEVMSRFKTKKEQTEIIERLKAGSTDIVIGTHRLLSKDMGFKDLGLLIIDEEHRFGVAAKEKLRRLRESVDTLTLTATPIPRTLHFSLMGARDLSIIATPPPNRLPVATEIAQYDEGLIREGVLRELHRGGQVFFVHDRVNNMEEVIGRLKAILPQVRFRHAHGQMHAHELEEVMLDFLEKKFDVLVATKIIESGIDMPSVNTIFINRADRFGMAELYQLRGRVGRSNVQAYAFLLTPPISSLPRETVRRLQAVEEFTDLGSGFNLAMRDLEIRGAGNLLGGEQSGFIESMGFEMYTKILEEAVGELKEQEFQNLFEQQKKAGESEIQTLVEADVDVRIPESYIENDSERLAVYRRLFALTNEEQLQEIQAELIDRFGKYLDEVDNLLALVRVRLKASKLGFRKIIISTTSITVEFPSESESQFYADESFQRLMSYVSRKRNKNLSLKESGKSLYLLHTFYKPDGLNPIELTQVLIEDITRSVQTPNERA